MMRNVHFYLVAILFGVTAGILELKFGDMLATALFIVVCTMILGASRPQRPWRWIVLVAVFVPVLRVVAYFALGQKPYLAQMWEPAFAFVVATVGAYCGVFARKAVENLLLQDGKTRG